MAARRWHQVAVGVLILVSVVAYVAGRALIAAALGAADGLADLDTRQVRAGVFLQYAGCLAAVGVGVLLYPVLRRHNELFAFGYAAARVVEAALLSVGALGVLSLIPLAVHAGEPAKLIGSVGAAEFEESVEYAGLAASRALATESYHLGFHLALAVLGTGSLLLCHILYQARLVPRPLAVLGFVGYLALFASGWLEIFGDGMPAVFYIPGAVFEIAFPIWLIVKGLHEPETPSQAVATA